MLQFSGTKVRHAVSCICPTVTEHTHEALVTTEIFELAQENLQEQDQHEERKQNLADVSFKVVQNR